MWKNQYKQLMFSEDTTEESTFEGLKLKLEKLANPIYKYCKINEYSLVNLERDEVWLSNAATFNDPYDSALTIGSRERHDNENKSDLYERFSKIFDKHATDVERLMDGYSIEDGLRRLLESLPGFRGDSEMVHVAIEKYLKETDSLFEEYSSDIANLYQKRTFASCFSEDPDSMLMWSHYADNHQGMVLKYDFLNLDFETQRDVFIGLNPVIYTEDLINLEEHKGVRDKISIATLAAISKSKEWSYEKEWRLIIHKNSSEKGIALKVIKPSCIILGARVSQVHKIMLSLEAKKKQIPIKQLKLDKTKYHLSVVDFNDFDLA
ncbi:DUF2971 domain-containing protein [Sporosarcina sp. Marseille-Q4943]|uniref:DUF2971 domain-containing protein n=1 Tax=Sporosarcina sp. Marseille-Q4943 TaxID=2942204 RepID=UPI00208DAA7B|nr:DUF2971 domain-containing protein [Sporosarcina sp. Marseille-Q4943]